MHNLHFFQDLMRGMRAAIEAGELESFRENFYQRYQSESGVE